MSFDNSKPIIEQMSWSSVNTRFPNTTFDAFQKSWIVKKFFGIEHADDKLKQMVSDNISKIQASRFGISTNKNSNKSAETAIAGLAKELGIAVEKSENRESKSLVLPEAIHLIEPTEASVDIFPKGLWCPNCNFYGIYQDFSKLENLICPNCKNGSLEQRSNIFVCPNCGRQEQMMPPFEKIENAKPTFDCPDDKCDGKLFLEIGNPLSRSTWFCSRTKEEKQRLFRPCPNCSRYRGIRDIIHMGLFFTSASYFKPQKISAVFDKDESDFLPSNAMGEWSLSDTSANRREQVLKFGIDNVQIIDEVNAVDIVYGYSTYGNNATPNFFNTTDSKSGRTVYDAYINKTKGRGLLISLNRETVCRAVLNNLEKNAGQDNNSNQITKIRELRDKLSKDVSATYKTLAEEQISQIVSRVISKKIDAPLIRLLHSFEHALTFQAPLSTGLEETSFQSKIFLKDCAVLIYERDEVEAGGVEFLCKNLLLDWLSDARKHVIECRYSCSDGCATCLFIQDPLCHPLMNTEVQGTYMLPNSLLSRELLVDFWGLREVVPIINKREQPQDQFGGT